MLLVVGPALSVQSIQTAGLIVTLSGTPPDATLGSLETLHPLLRRWDQTNGDPDEGGLTLANPVALPPHGITHYYAPLAVISVSATGAIAFRRDCRCPFSSLSICPGTGS